MCTAADDASGDMFGTESHTTNARAMHVHLILLSLALALSIALSVAAVFDPHFHPSQYPANALHWVAIAWASSVSSDSKLQHTVSIIATLMGSIVLFLSADSYFPNWSASDAYLRKVYQGTTRPYWNVDRVTNEVRDDGMYVARCVLTIACAVLMLISCCSHLSALNDYDRVEDAEDQARPSCTTRVVYWIAAFVVLFDLVLSLLPYARWIVVDSPHVALIAGLLVFWPRGRVRWVVVALLLCGVVVSSVSLKRTIESTQTAHADWLSMSSYRGAFVHETFGLWWYEPIKGHDEDGGFAFSSWVLHFSEWILLVLGSARCAYLVTCG